MFRMIVLATCLTLTTIPVVNGVEHWTRFRGEDGNSVAKDNTNLPTRWNTTENVRWAIDLRYERAPDPTRYSVSRRSIHAALSGLRFLTTPAIILRAGR